MPPLRLPSLPAAERSVASSRTVWSGRGVEGALATRNGHLQLFDVALRNNAGIALLQFAFGVEFVLRLLQRAFCLLKLTFRLLDIGLRRQHGGIDFGDLAFGCQ